LFPINANNNNIIIATLANELYRTMSSVSFVSVFSVLCYNNNDIIKKIKIIIMIVVVVVVVVVVIIIIIIIILSLHIVI